MPIDPTKYTATESDIRKRLKLTYDYEIIPTGYENLFEREVREKLGQNFSLVSQEIRNLPDYLILNHKTGDSFFLEWKDEKCNSLEAVQLLQNKFRCRNGCKVFYSINEDIFVNALEIPMNTIQIPLKRKEEFESFSSHLFSLEDCELNFWVRNSNGSGDPFIWIYHEELKNLSGENLQ